MAVARGNGIHHSLFGFFRYNLKDAKSQCRNFDAIIHFYALHDVCSVMRRADPRRAAHHTPPLSAAKIINPDNRYHPFRYAMNLLHNLDLNLLRALHALLEEGNVTRAAARLSLSQPAVSGMLARLRRVFDDPLLVRSGQGMVLTPRAAALPRAV